MDENIINELYKYFTLKYNLPLLADDKKAIREIIKTERVSNSATANVRQESEVQANDVLLADMTLLCKLCAEYSSNKTNIFLTESEKENAKKYEHYAWVVKRATIKLGILEDRQIEIKKLIFSK